MHALWTKLSLLNTKRSTASVCKPALRESVWLGPAQRQQHLGPRPAAWSISASTMPCLEVLWGQRRWCTKPSSCVSRCRALGGTSLLPHRGREGGCPGPIFTCPLLSFLMWMAQRTSRHPLQGLSAHLLLFWGELHGRLQKLALPLLGTVLRSPFQPTVSPPPRPHPSSCFFWDIGFWAETADVLSVAYPLLSPVTASQLYSILRGLKYLRFRITAAFWCGVAHWHFF